MENLQIKPYQVTNRQDILSYLDMEFYNSETFTTVSDFIFTYDKPVIQNGFEDWDDQSIYITTSTHSIDATPYEIQKNILKSAINTLTDMEKEVLVKVSSCTHYTDKYEEEVSDKIKEGCEMFMGKWYFQPDQRRKTENEVILEDPKIAKYTSRYDERFPIKPSHVNGEIS